MSVWNGESYQSKFKLNRAKLSKYVSPFELSYCFVLPMPISKGSAALFIRINKIIFQEKKPKKHSNWPFFQIIAKSFSMSEWVNLIFQFNKIKEKNKNKNEKK